MHPSLYAAPRYRIRLLRMDLPAVDATAVAEEAVGLARGRVVGLRTADIYLEAEEARRVLAEWLGGGDGSRTARWRGEIVDAGLDAEQPS